MKKVIFLFVCIFSAHANAQTGSNFPANTAQVFKENLPVIYITCDVNLHFRTPEPVQFVDLSTDKLIGDLPIENVVRIKIQQKQDENRVEIVKRTELDKSNKKKETAALTDTIKTTTEVQIPYFNDQQLGIVTIVGQSFMAQYKIVFRDKSLDDRVLTNIEITPQDMQPLEYPHYEFSCMELKNHAMELISKKERSPIRKSKTLKLTAQLNNIYTLGDYVFLDVSFKNQTNLSYDINQLRFSIEDKKVYKSTNVQAIELEPVYQLYHNKKFHKSYRNIYVFKKITYPNNKILMIRLMEDQISGRTIELGIKYSDVLQADTF